MWLTIVSLSKERKWGQIMARAKPFMEQLQGAIKKFSVKCCSAWVDPNNAAAFGPLSSSDWLTFIAEWIPFHSEEVGGRAEGWGREPGRQMGRTRLEGGSMRPEGSLDVIWPDYWILIQQQGGIRLCRLPTFLLNNKLWLYIIALRCHLKQRKGAFSGL